MIITTLPYIDADFDQSDEVKIEISAFLDELADAAAWPSKECKSKADKLNSPSFMFCRFKPDAASRQASEIHPGSFTNALAYDVDIISVDEMGAALPEWAKHSAVLYSTWRHTRNKPKFRLIVEVKDPIPNYDQAEYSRIYRAVGEALGIPYDIECMDRGRAFFAPQHAPGVTPERHRFTGPPVDAKKIAAGFNDSGEKRRNRRETVNGFETTGSRPSRQDLKKIAGQYQKSKTERRALVGSAIAAICRGESFAPQGSVHNTTMHIAFELVRVYPQLDAGWFASEFMVASWAAMPYAGSALGERREAWAKVVSSAKVKHIELREESDKYRATVESVRPLTPAELTEVEEMRGKLVVSYRRAYYIYDVRCHSYKGPFAPGEVAVAVRDCLAGVPGVSEVEYTKTGIILKSSTKLSHEYGTTAAGVSYYARKPKECWDAESETIGVQAYSWIKWEPVYHPICDELLRAVSGRHYLLLEAYLFKFRDLDQPLPALTLVGPRGIWKSRICEILSRFWGAKDAPTPGDADKIMSRFNMHLLKNPVVWSDESLAITHYGRPQPEAYRKSITARTHAVEPKGGENVSLFSAVRHMISVNDDAKVFSSEVDADSVLATMERFLLLYPDTVEIESMEKKWYGTPELDRMRSGESLLEHVRWIEENTSHVTTGRLFVTPHTDARVLLRAKFGDETLSYIWDICFDFLQREHKNRSARDLKFYPFLRDEDGNYRVSPKRIHDLWSSSQITTGSSVKKPTAQRIGRILNGSGFKLNKNDKAVNCKHKAWLVNIDVLKQFLEANDTVSIGDIEKWTSNGGGKSTNDSKDLSIPPFFDPEKVF